MMTAVARHIAYVPLSRAYYDKKRAEGKKHNQAIRSLGRHLVRVIWALVKKGKNTKYAKIRLQFQAGCSGLYFICKLKA